MKKTLSIVAVSLLALSGCATRSSFTESQLREMNAAVASGQCPLAYTIAGQTTNAVQYFNYAFIAGECEHNRDKAINYLNYGARLGEQNSINGLLKMGQPVPAPDLVRQQSSGANDAALGIMLLQAAQPRPAPAPAQRMLNCNSVPGSFGQVNTTCW